MKPSAALEVHRAEIRWIVEANKVTNPRVFGSVELVILPSGSGPLCWPRLCPSDDVGADVLEFFSVDYVLAPLKPDWRCGLLTSEAEPAVQSMLVNARVGINHSAEILRLSRVLVHLDFHPEIAILFLSEGRIGEFESYDFTNSCFRIFFDIYFYAR